MPGRRRNRAAPVPPAPDFRFRCHRRQSVFSLFSFCYFPVKKMCYGSIMICMESGRYAARGASSAGERMANSSGTAGDVSPAINSKSGSFGILMTHRIPFMISQSALHMKFCPFVKCYLPFGRVLLEWKRPFLSGHGRIFCKGEFLTLKLLLLYCHRAAMAAQCLLSIYYNADPEEKQGAAETECCFPALYPLHGKRFRL